MFATRQRKEKKDNPTDSQFATVPSQQCCLKIAQINVNGLRGKMKYPDFEDFISHYDIICVSESKLDDCCNLDFKGFDCYMNNRIKLSASPSWGLALLVSGNISKYMTHMSA